MHGGLEYCFEPGFLAQEALSFRGRPLTGKLGAHQRAGHNGQQADDGEEHAQDASDPPPHASTFATFSNGFLRGRDHGQPLNR